LAAFASLSVPLYAMLQNGQDTGILLFLASLSIVLARKNSDLLAGVALSLCAIKPHLFLLIPLILALQRRWRILYGGGLGGLFLLTISFISGGWSWPRAYWANLEGQTKLLEYMPNIHTVSVLLGNGPADLAAEASLSALVIMATIYLGARVTDYELAFTFGLIGSLLISFHSYTQDCLLLLLSLAIILQKQVIKSVRWLTELAASPIAYFLLLSGSPFNIAMPCMLGGILALSVKESLRLRRVPI
jgi:glycosyl transferase family 87